MDVSAFIDWISITHKKNGNFLPDGIPTTHKTSGGKIGYTHAKEYTSGVLEMINPERGDMGIHFIYTGKVLENLQSQHGITRDDILRQHTTNGGKLSRIDFAIDVKNSSFSIDTVWDNLENKTAVTKSTHSRTQNGNNAGYTVYVGSRKKRKKLLRVYDKAKEQKDFVSDYIRVELQLNGLVAREGAKMYQDNDYSTETIKSLIKGFADFPEYDTWNDVFNCECLKIPVGTAGDGQTETWLLKQVAPAMARVLIDNEDFIHKFYESVNFHMHKILQNNDE